MSTAITDFYGGIRVLIGDRNASAYRYQDSTLLVTTQTIIRMGKVEDYALTPDLLSITPSVTDPNPYALTILHSALVLSAPEADGYAWRTRSMSQNRGAKRELLWMLRENIHELENGTMFTSWQSFGSWLQGAAGIDLAFFMTKLSAINMLGSMSVLPVEVVQ